MSTLAPRHETGDRTGPHGSEASGEVTALPDLETFSPCVGERFVVEALLREGESALVLVAAEALPPQPGAPRERPFVLLFRGPADTGLGQGMVRLSHPRTGPVELFVVPVVGRGEGAFYEAVFN
jgi:hypothetical protein